MNNIWDDENDPNYHPELDDRGAPPIEEPRQRRVVVRPHEEAIEMDQDELQSLMEDAEVEGDDEEVEMETALSDARLRLEMGRLYEMVMQSDLFNNLDADPQAIKNVQRQIKRFAKEQMEIMLGMRGPKQESTQVVSPFNEIEIEVLKRLAFTATKGASASAPAPARPQAQLAPAAPKKTSLTPIGHAKPVAKIQPKPVAPLQRKQVPKKPVVESEPLEKPVNEMSDEELLARNAETAERQRQNKAAIPKDRLPPMAPEAMNAMYTSRVQNDANSAAVSQIVAILNKQ